MEHRRKGGRRPDSRSRRARLTRTLVVAAIVSLPLLILLILNLGSTPSTSSSLPAGSSAAELRIDPGGVLRIEPWTLLAALHAATPVYPSARVATATSTLRAPPIGGAVVLPALRAESGRLQLRLPGPPNDASGWVAANDVALTRTAYFVVVDLTGHELLLFDRGKLALRAPADVGALSTPTPLGSFFVTAVAEAPSPDYGPFVVVTSGIVEGTSDWHQGDNSVVSINGPVDSPSVIPAGGAATTTGSVRLNDADLERLAVLPVGAPVDVVGTVRSIREAGG